MNEPTKTVKVIVYVDGVESAQAESQVPEQLVNQVLGTICAQVENVDELED